jgi:hypothetical protein
MDAGGACSILARRFMNICFIRGMEFAFHFDQALWVAVV